MASAIRKATASIILSAHSNRTMVHSRPLVESMSDHLITFRVFADSGREGVLSTAKLLRHVSSPRCLGPAPWSRDQSGCTGLIPASTFALCSHPSTKCLVYYCQDALQSPASATLPTRQSCIGPDKRNTWTRVPGLPTTT